MISLEELTLKVKKRIEYERENNLDIKYMEVSKAGVVAQIIHNMKL